MKNHHHNGPVLETSPTHRHVIHEVIALHAYELWQRYGKPENQTENIWLEAEREIATGHHNVPADIALPVSF